LIKCNIVEIVYNWPAEVFIQRHIESLSEHGLTPIVVARHDDESSARSASIQKAAAAAYYMPNFNRLTLRQKIYNLKYLVGSGDGGRSSDLPLRDRVLLAYFKSFRSDLIHFHSASLAVMMSWIPRRLGIPYTLSLRGTDVQITPLLSEEYRLKLSEALQMASGVHSVCDSLWKTAVKNCFLEENSIFHRTIYTTVPIPNQFKEYKKKSSSAPYHFISVGRIHWTKSYHNLILALRSLLDCGINVALTIVGDGPARDELCYWIHDLGIEDRVVLPGKLSYPDFMRVMLQSDAYIQSSIAEGFSNATAEAMALGMPVFATSVGGTDEIIHDGENGILLDAHNPQDWCQKLSMVRNDGLMKQLGINAKKSAQEVFSASRHAADFLSFYQDALNA